MSDEAMAYPLNWPAGWRRTESVRRTRAKFHREDRSAGYAHKLDLTVADALARLIRELEMIGAWTTSTVISTNVELRQDGLPYSNRRPPQDPGVAVYWQKGKAKRCIAVDRYDRVQDNMAAIAATLEAMRAIDRHGGAEILDRAFTGFTALPAPEQWWQVLGVKSTATRAEIEAAYRALAAKHHPDRGGDATEMARINVARDAGYEVSHGA